MAARLLVSASMGCALWFTEPRPSACRAGSDPFPRHFGPHPTLNEGNHAILYRRQVRPPSESSDTIAGIDHGPPIDRVSHTRETEPGTCNEIDPAVLSKRAIVNNPPERRDLEAHVMSVR
jgi:hypothetical protein